MQKSLAKKIFAVGLAASTALWGLAPMAAFAAPHAAGTNVLGSDGTVYMVTTDGQRRPYTSAGAFNSYGFNSFASVVDANADDLALPVGSFIPPQDGKIICSDKDDSYAVAGTCYLITGGQRAAFTSATVFTGRGYSFSRSSTGDVSWMSTTGMIDDTTSAHRPGVLVNNNGTVQLVGTSGLLGIPDLTTFNSWGFSFADVVPANAADQAMTQTGVMAARVAGQLSPTFTTGGGTNPPPVGGGLSVGLASNNPAAVVIADGSANNTLLRVNLSAGSTAVSVTGINFTKTGFTANTNVTGVGVYVNGVRHGNVITTLGADGIALTTFGSEPIVVPAGSSVVVEVRVNIGTSADSGTIGLKIASASDVTSNASSVSGTFPVEGNVFTTVDGSSSLAGVTLDVQPVNSTGITYNVDANSAQRITKFRVVETTSNEGINLQSLTLWNNGTAADTDVADLELRDQTGVILATAQQIGKEVVFVLASPYFIDKGQTKDFEVWGKVVDGAARTIQYTVYNDYDLYVVGSLTNTGILPTAAGGVDSTFPIGDKTTSYNRVTVGSGSIIFSRATDSPSSAMVPGSTDQVLARYDVKAIGENMEVRLISFGIATGAGNLGLTGTVYVKIDGNIIYSAASNVTNFLTTGAASSRTPSSYYVLTAGENHVIEVIGSVSSSAGATDSYKVKSFDITSVKRLVTNDITDPSVAALDGLTRSVNSAALTVRTLPTPVATTYVAVASGVELANFELDASASGEDVRVSALTVTDTTSSTAAIAGISGLQMYVKNSDGSLTALSTSSSTDSLTAGSGVGTVAFNFNSPIVVSTTNKVTLVLKGNILSGSVPASHTFSIANATGNVTASGATTGNTIAYAAQTISGSGQAMSVGTGGTLTGSLLSGTGATPSALQVVSVATQDGTYFAFKLNAQYEAQKITSLTIRATGTSLNNNTIKGIELYRKVGTVMDTTPFATAPSGFTNCSSNICTYTWTGTDNILPDAIQPGSPIEVYVKADIGPTGQAYLGDNFGFSMDMTSGNDITSKGVTSGNAPTYAGGYLNNATANRTYVVPFTVVISGSSPTEGSTVQSSVAANTTLGRFKLQNNGSAQVTITNATFTDSGSQNSAATSTRYTMTVTAQGSSSGTDVTATTAASSVGFGALTNTFTLDGGGFRYADIKNSAGASDLVSGDTFNLSVSTLGNLTYSVTEAALGYDGNQDGDFSDTITGLYADGIPVLGTIQKQ